MKQDATWVMVSDSFDPILLFKLIEKFVLKQSDNQYKMAVLIAKQLSILSFCQDIQVLNATYYDWFITRVEDACQAGVCYYTPDLLDTKVCGVVMQQVWNPDVSWAKECQRCHWTRIHSISFYQQQQLEVAQSAEEGCGQWLLKREHWGIPVWHPQGSNSYEWV
jgi:hypothetical protein